MGLDVPLQRQEQELRAIARERVVLGVLPCTESSHLWGGYGSGSLCALCDQPIPRDEVEYEVECQIEGKTQIFRFHILCQALWRSECARG
jgi:hypothetical protein